MSEQPQHKTNNCTSAMVKGTHTTPALGWQWESLENRSEQACLKDAVAAQIQLIVPPWKWKIKALLFFFFQVKVCLDFVKCKNLMIKGWQSTLILKRAGKYCIKQNNTSVGRIWFLCCSLLSFIQQQWGRKDFLPGSK